MLYRRPPDAGHPLVALRAMVPADATAWFRYLALPEVYRDTSWNVRDVAELRALIDATQPATPGSPLRFAIVLREGGALVGAAGFHTVSPSNRTAEIAYDLDPAYWGRGIATRVCACLAAWAFDEMDLVRVQATVLRGNERSARVLQRCRFQREGLLRHYRLVRGVPGDFWMYALLGPAASP